MKTLRALASTDLVAIATDADAFALPPSAYAVVPSWWNAPAGVVPELELEMWATGTVAVTAAVLYGATPHAFSFADVTFTAELAVASSLDLSTKTTHCDTVIEAADAGESGDYITIAFTAGDSLNAGHLDESAFPALVFHYKTAVTLNSDFDAAVAASTYLAVKTASASPATALVVVADAFGAAHLAGGGDTSLVAVAHGFETGDGPVRGTGTLPGGLETATNYWTIKDGTGEFNLASSQANALLGTAIEITDVGSGTMKIVATASTERIYWQTHDGLLGLDGDGAIGLTSKLGYRKRLPHSPRVVAYALSATLDTGTASAAIVPIQDQG